MTRLLRRLAIAAALVALLAGVLFAPLPWRVTNSVTTGIDIRRPPDEVFRYVSTPVWWPRWHPSSLHVSGDVGHSLKIGEQAVERYSVAGREGTALWVVTEREPDRRWTIVGDIGGRRSGQVSYRMQPIADGTRFERTFDYYPPNLLFVLLDRWRIHEKIQEESQRAVEQLKRELEGGARASAG